MVALLSLVPTDSACTTWLICSASSRVGVTISARGIPRRTVEQFVENGEDECGGLACAGLCGADDVASAQGGGDGRFLDGSGGFIASVLDSQHQAGIEIKLFEVQNIPVLQKSCTCKE